MVNTRKFALGDIALWRKPIVGVGLSTMMYYCVIVDYKQDGTGRGSYRVVRVLHPANGGSFGEPVWTPPEELDPLPQYRARMHTVRIYRANKRLVERECTCNCCPHIAIARSEINDDGTFAWEVEDE